MAEMQSGRDRGRYSARESRVCLGNYQSMYPSNMSIRTKLWESEISKSPPVADFKEIMASDHGVKDWLNNIVGFFIPIIGDLSLYDSSVSMGSHL